MLKNIETSKVLNLEKEIAYEKNKVVNKILANSDGLKMVLFAFDGKQELATHTAPGDALVIALDGGAKIVINGKDFIIKKGDSIVMPANAPHSVHIEEKYKMLLIISK